MASTPEPIMGRITSPIQTNEEKLDLDEGGWDNSSPLVPPKLTWRDVQQVGQHFSNWTIVVRSEDVEGAKQNTKTYHVHKTVLSIGERASGYFHTQFTLETPTRENEENTSVLHLPPLCVGSSEAWEVMLDFMYDGELALDAAVAVPLMELARRLQIPALGRKVMAWAEEALQQPGGAAPQLLMHAIELRLEKTQAAAMQQIRRNFGSFSAVLLAELPIASLLCLLGDDDLGVESEDQVYAVVAYLVDGSDDNISANNTVARDLWACVRYAHLTPTTQCEALRHPTCPRDLFIVDALHALQLERGPEPARLDEDSVRSRHLTPFPEGVELTLSFTLNLNLHPHLKPHSKPHSKLHSKHHPTPSRRAGLLPGRAARCRQRHRARAAAPHAAARRTAALPRRHLLRE